MLETENTKLRADNADLRRRLGENSSNSNKPPSSDPPGQREERTKPTPSGRAPGGQPGHKGTRRTLLPASKVTRSSECYPPECRRCGTDLPRRPEPDPLRHQVFDVPKIEADVHEFRQHCVTCTCGAITCGELPSGTPQRDFAGLPVRAKARLTSCALSRSTRTPSCPLQRRRRPRSDHTSAVTEIQQRAGHCPVRPRRTVFRRGSPRARAIGVVPRRPAMYFASSDATLIRWVCGELTATRGQGCVAQGAC